MDEATRMLLHPFITHIGFSCIILLLEVGVEPRGDVVGDVEGHSSVSGYAEWIGTPKTGTGGPVNFIFCVNQYESIRDESTVNYRNILTKSSRRITGSISSSALNGNSFAIKLTSFI